MNAPPFKPKEIGETATTPYLIEGVSKYLRPGREQKSEPKDPALDYSFTTETKEEFDANLDNFERVLGVEKPVNDEFLKALVTNSGPFEIDRPVSDGLWGLDLKFISTMQEKCTSKCKCGQCQGMFKPHEYGDCHWYNDHLGCSFTEKLLEFFEKPKNYLFNENM